jgi:hypothetical protein
MKLLKLEYEPWESLKNAAQAQAEGGGEGGYMDMYGGGGEGYMGGNDTLIDAGSRGKKPKAGAGRGGSAGGGASGRGGGANPLRRNRPASSTMP